MVSDAEPGDSDADPGRSDTGAGSETTSGPFPDQADGHGSAPGLELDEHVDPSGRSPWAAGAVALGCILVAILAASWLLGDVLRSADRLTNRFSVPVGLRIDAVGTMFVQTASCADAIQEVTVSEVNGDASADPAADSGDEDVVFHAFFGRDVSDDPDAAGREPEAGSGLFHPGLDAHTVEVSRESNPGLIVDVFTLDPANNQSANDPSGSGPSASGPFGSGPSGSDPAAADFSGTWAVQVTTKRGSGAAMVVVPEAAEAGVYADAEGRAVSTQAFSDLECSELE